MRSPGVVYEDDFRSISSNESRVHFPKRSTASSLRIKIMFVLQFRQYRVIFLCERIARCASPAVYTEHHLCSSYICGLGVTRPLPITQALDCRKTTLYCLNLRYGKGNEHGCAAVATTEGDYTDPGVQ